MSAAVTDIGFVTGVTRDGVDDTVNVEDMERCNKHCEKVSTFKEIKYINLEQRFPQRR